MSCCAGLADANSSGHDAFVTGYEALLASVLSVPASQAELMSLQTGITPASPPTRRQLLTSQVHFFLTLLALRLCIPGSQYACATHVRRESILLCALGCPDLPSLVSAKH